MERPRHIGDLADELLSDILSFLTLGTDASVNEERYGNRQSMTSRAVESNGSKFGESSDLDKFRLVCKRFMRISTPRKFPRFVLRFSKEGFQRLEELLNMQLACHTKYFTYMVRPFYRGGWDQFLGDMSPDSLPVSRLHRDRLNDQNALVVTGYDLALLRKAIAAFPSLQQIKLLRLQDEADREILEYIRGHGIEGVSLDWKPACSHAIANLGRALLESSCHSIRFIGPQISPEAALKLLQAPKTTLSAIGARLTCLDMNFHSTRDVTDIMDDLSDVFGDFFAATKNLVTINFGFPTKHPLDLRLDAIFHHTQWQSLRILGIQGWRLDSSEIVDLARRHQRQLRELRMPNVYLRSGSRWRDVLSVLHDEMDQLDRVDLREIDYAENFDAEKMTNGIEIPESPPTPPLPLVWGNHPTQHLTLPPINGDLPVATRGQEDPSQLRAATGFTPEALRVLTVDDLGDNGIKVSHQQRPLWEAWVVSRPRSVNLRRL